MITLSVCSETKKLSNWSHDRISFTDFKVWTIWTAQLKLNKQYSRKVLLRSFHLIGLTMTSKILKTKKGFIWIVTQHDFLHRLGMLEFHKISSKSTLGQKGDYLTLEKKFWTILLYWLAMFFFNQNYLKSNMIFRYILICAIGLLQFSLA